jgi:hypothetical protein
VHTRRPFDLGARGLAAFILTVGAAIVSAGAHAPALAWLGSAVLVGLAARGSPSVPLIAIGVLVSGALAAWTACAIGAARAGLRYRPSDVAESPLYWSLLSLAFVHAAWRLVVEPFVWDKTPHEQDRDRLECLDDEDAGREAA